MKGFKIGGIRSAAFVVAAVAAAMFATTSQAAAQAVDMTGTWTLQVDVQGQVSSPTVTFQQDGTDLTGTYTSEAFGEQAITGSVDGSDVTWSFEGVMSAQGQELPVTATYAGTVDEEGVFTGTIDLGGMISGNVTGTRD